MLQGPESEQESIQKVIEGIRQGEAAEASIINYRKDGRPFTNQVAVGRTLRILPRTELVAAVLRAPPPPLQAARFDAETSELLTILSSCNGPRVEMLEMIRNSGLPLRALQEGERWMLDAEGTLNRILRLPPIRQLFLKTALESANSLSADATMTSSKDGGAKEKAVGELKAEQATHMQQVRLMMHSDNVLYERDHYLKIAISLWAELADLNRVDGWEYRHAVHALTQRFVVPDRGSRRHAALWRGLRSAVYDPLSARERELRDASSDDQPSTEDLREAMSNQARKTVPVSMRERTAADAIEVFRAQQRIKIMDPEEDADEGAPSEIAAEDLPPDELLEFPPDELRGAKDNDDAHSDVKSGGYAESTGSAGTAMSGFRDESSLRSGRRGKHGKPIGEYAGSQTSSVATNDDSLKDMSMLSTCCSACSRSTCCRPFLGASAMRRRSRRCGRRQSTRRLMRC